MDTTKLTFFVAALDAGSLSLAARRLGAQLSTVSRQIADLEAAVGATLLQRTGRGVRPTPVGERFAERARRVLLELEAASSEARGERQVELAQLRLSVPVELSLQLMPAVLAELCGRHEGLSIDVHSDARRVSLLEEDFDAAIRIGPLPSSELLRRRLGSISVLCCARPEVAATIRSVADLRAREFVQVAGGRSELRGTLRGTAVRIATKGMCRVSTFTEAAALSASSDRVVLLPSITAARWLSDKRLAPALRGLALPSTEAHLVYPSTHQASAVMKTLGDLVTAGIARAETVVLAAAQSKEPPRARTRRR